MPALVLFRNFTTRPFGGDDLHVPCLVLGLFRLVQLICLLPLCVHYYLRRVRAEDVWVNGVPPWCNEYEASDVFLLHVKDLGGEGGIASFERNNFGLLFVVLALVYFAADVCWICMVWSAASLGTPTESKQRDKYLRKLIAFKMFVGNVFPLLLLIFGVRKIYLLRENNYGCGDGEPATHPDQGIWYGFFSALLVTYALELFILPAALVNHVIRALRKQSFVVRSQTRTEEKTERLERYIGLALRVLQCITWSKTDFRNAGELSEFAVHFMELMNYNTKLDVVLSDLYVGLRLLSRVQAEEKAKAIKRLSQKSRHHRHHFEDGQWSVSEEASSDGEETSKEVDDPSSYHSAFHCHRRNSMMVLSATDSSTFDIHERDVLGGTATDQQIMSDVARHARYAQIIYHRLKNLIEEEFVEGKKECTAGFKRDLDTLFRREYLLEGIGCEKAMLCHASFANSLSSTPYCILVDEEVEKVVISVRGTLSLDDMVVDLQYNPSSLEKAGTACGFDGKNRHCHKGILNRAKWLFNDIKRTRVLKTLYSKESPFKDFSLVLCGHSLGAGCATLLSIMLRSAFPSLKCFAYCPPGGIVDKEMASLCDDFVTSIVRQDDVVPRISHHNMELLRDEFLDCVARIKVPKIKAFYDVRAPCLDMEAHARNQEVLRSTNDIPRGTPFYMQVQKFRAERDTKNIHASVDAANLFIAGKIIHLVDTAGAGDRDAGYVAYWADREEDFNQVILSSRLKSDHSMIELVSLLKDFQLTNAAGQAMSTDVYRSLNVAEVDAQARKEKDAEFRLFMCGSFPDGKKPILLLVVALSALVLSWLSMTNCVFFARESTAVFALEGQALLNLDIPFSMGLFSYTLLECVDEDGSCYDGNETDVAVPSGFCVPYPDDVSTENHGFLQASRAFAFLTVLFGGISFLMLCISTCLRLRRWAWRFISGMFLSTSLFQGLVFLIDQSDLCVTVRQSVDDGIGLTLVSESDCYIHTGAIEAIVAASLYFIVALGSCHIARRRSESTAD